MITRTQWKPLDGRGIVPFTVNKSITLDLYTCDKDKEGTKQTFMKDSKFEGQLVKARISKRLLNGAFVPHTETSGLMVTTPDKSGYYFGAGVGLVHATWIPIETGTHQIPNITSNSFTPIVEAGTRVRVGRAEYYTDLGLFYKFNSSPNAKHNIYGLKFTYYLK